MVIAKEARQVSEAHLLLHALMHPKPPVGKCARKRAEKLVEYLRTVVGYGGSYEEYYRAMDRYIEKTHQRTHYTYEGGCTCPVCVGRDYVESLLMWYDLDVVEGEIERQRRLGRW